MRRTIPTLFRATVERVPDRTWLIDPGGQRTFAEAQAVIERMAAGLRESGVGAGDRVLVTGRNEPRYLLCWLALMETGAIQVPLNPAGSVAELEGFIRQAEPAAVVTDTGLADPVRAAVAAVGSTARALDVDVLANATADGRGPTTVEPDDVAVMIPTSGTTGRSKLVMQTHRAYVMAGEGFPWWLGLTGDDRLMTSLPLFHLNAPAYSTLGSVAAGAGMVLLPAFSAGSFLDSAREHGATQFNAIGAMVEILMRRPERPDDADNPLRLCYTGPSPERSRQEEIEARFGLEVVCGYALSESPYGLVWRPGTRPYGTLGSPRQHPTLGRVNEARVMARDGEADREVAPGEVGELELRNPAIMRGYFRMPEETGATVVDGWLRTGDLVRDEGDDVYTFIGRLKNVIRRRGENLSPDEVEAAAERHRAVAEAAVIAVPSDLGEDDVKIFVVPAPSIEIDLDDLFASLTAALARFKVPRYVEIVDELPHTATGRVARHRLPTDRTAEEIDRG